MTTEYRYVLRNENGDIVGDFFSEQDYAKELLPHDHPELLKFHQKQKDKIVGYKEVKVNNTGPTDLA